MDNNAAPSIPIEVSLGEQLSSVEFVQDYVQLRFDGPNLTLFVRPSLHFPGRTIRFGEQGYRDELCGRITHKVQQARIRWEEYMLIEFDYGVELIASLKAEDRTGPEAGYFATSATGGALLDF